MSGLWKTRLARGAGVGVLVLLVTLLIWQGSFTFGPYGPRTPEQTYLFWAVSTLVFLLTVTLGFMLSRTALKLYIERQAGKEGSRIKTKLVVGALALSFMPVIFLVVFDIHVLNRNLDKWFSRPAENIKLNLSEIAAVLAGEMRARVEAQALWLAASEELRNVLASRQVRPGALEVVCRERKIDEVWLELPGAEPVVLCRSGMTGGEAVAVRAPVRLPEGGLATVEVRDRIAVDLFQKQQEIARSIAEYNQLAQNKRDFRNFYLALLVLISLFLLFLATWVGLFFARQISVPIAATLEAIREVRSGNLATRVHVKAIDELAVLVRGFNEMTQELEANAKELERRRRFTEAILENIPTGIISLSPDGRILRVNRALSRIFPPEQAAGAKVLDDLFSREDAAEIRYLMKRARRLGIASRQLEIRPGGKTVHASITISALEAKPPSGYVMMIEDTSELLQAQKAAAWHEVARRIAHEIKNPLTPIALSADRLARQLERTETPPEFERIARQCTQVISREVESVKALVNEFSQFARFPAAKLAPAELNPVVREALEAFQGRLEGIDLQLELAPNLPLVNIDREQIKRVVVNLVDNAAEAMLDAPVKRLLVATQMTSTDSVELIIADTGCGVSMEDKEKLFLPYFSTKGRGTGLGLAIVSHILSDHNAQIRVEDNAPTGARFSIEFPAVAAEEAERGEVGSCA